MTNTLQPATEASPRPESPAEGPAAYEEGAWVVYTLLFSSAAIIIGLLWDISWHMTIGRDTLWSPPHVLEQIGAASAGLACGWLVLRTTFAGTESQRGRAVGFWGFRGPLGAWVAIWGSFAMVFSVPFDDWWHNAYGLDVEILSPPHVVLLFGMVGIQVGAMLLTLGFQNRASERSARRFGLAYAFAAGALLAMVGTASSEYTLYPNLWHGGLFYVVTAVVFGFFLAAMGRGGKLRWPATAAAVAYSIMFLLPQWILIQFPATPRLSPIVNPIGRMAAFGFPLLLVAPALLLDALASHRPSRGDWKRALAAGPLFVIVMLAVHWPFASFLVESPLARNDFFVADHWAYFNGPGDWQREFWNDGFGGPGAAGFARNLAIASVLGIISIRAGLWWGSWMRKVQR